MTTEAVVEGSGGVQAAGEQLGKARQAAGLSLDQAASQLRVPLHVISALEQGHWERLGAPVFIRGQLRSYARLLQVDPAPLIAQVPAEQMAPVALVSHSSGPALRRYTHGLGRKLAYAAVAVVVVVPAALMLRSWLQPQAAVASLDVVPAEAVEVGTRLSLPGSVDLPDAGQVPAAPLPQTQTQTPVQAAAALPASVPATTVAADAAAVQTASAPASGAQLQLTFAGDSWIEIAGPQGQVVEKALVTAGQQRSYPAAAVGRVLLGNSTKVQASINGRAIDLGTMGRSNVARFTVSSDGSVSPLSQ